MLAWLMLALGCRSPRPDAPPDAPNILLISLDTVRSDHLSSYGHRRDTSPHLAALSQGGARFTHSHAQASATTPTHASLFTGLHPFEHHAYGYRNALADEHTTLAEILQAQGWHTVAATASMKFDRGTGFSQGFDSYRLFGEEKKNRRSEKVNEAIHAALAEEATRPVFAFVHYFDAHAPYSAPAPYRTRFHEGLDTLKPEQTIGFISDNRTTPVAADKLAYLAALYDGNIAFLDDNVHALLTELSAANGRETLLVITSDHGEAFQEHGYLGHSSWVYEEILTVPLVVHWPGTVPAGLTIDTPVQSIDVLPTLGELVGFPVPDGLPGRSHAAALRGGAATPSRTVAGVVDPVIAFNRPKWWGISGTIDGARYKLSRHGSGEPTLSSLTADPHTRNNILATHRAQATALMQAAEAMGVPLSEKSEQYLTNHREISAEQVEQLKAMGYLDEAEGSP